MNKSLATRILPPQFLNALDRIIGPHNKKAHDRKGDIKRDCSPATRGDRDSILRRAFADLYKLGFKLQSPYGLKERHLRALAQHWEAKRLSPSTLHKRFSILRVFAAWIGKRGLVRDNQEYFKDPTVLKRTSIATTNLAWDANGVDVDKIIQQAKAIDERLGLLLALQHNFGLRVKESIHLKPLHKALSDDVLEVYQGTKGGRPRLVPIETQQQQDVVAWAERVAAESKSGTLYWPRRTWMQSQSRFYRLLKKIGVTKAQLGVTAHGLRHGDAQRTYTKVTGLPSPIQGGALGAIDWGTHRRAAIRVSVRLGHNRVYVGSNYYGSYGHQLRNIVSTFTAGNQDLERMAPNVVEKPTTKLGK